MSAEGEMNFALNALSNLCLSERLSDVHFICDEVSIPAHKTILAASSPYFERILFGEANKTIKEINLVTKPHLFEFVLKYIYTGVANIEELNDSDVIGLYTLCNNLEFPRLYDAIKNRLNAIELNTENIGLIFEAAKSNPSALLSKCWDFIDSNAEEIVENKEEFAKFSYELIRRIVGRESFRPTEIKLFEALVYWREQHGNMEMPEVFKNIRLNLIEAKDFSTIVRPTRLISDDDYFASF